MSSNNSSTSPSPRPVVVLGAGIAGLFSAHHLSKAGFDVVVVDESVAIGGAHRSREIGPYTFDAGSIFYEETARIFDFAPGLRDACPTVKRKQRRIVPGGKVRAYPINPKEVMSWSRARLARALGDLVVSRARFRRNGTLERICLSRLGWSFYVGTGLKNYVERFHNVPGREIDEEFFLRRMGYIAKATEPAELFRLLRRQFARKKTPDKIWPDLRIRPPGGFHQLFGPIRANLEARGVVFKLGSPVRRVSRDGSEFVIETATDRLRAGAVVSAVPLDTIYRALFDRPSGLESLDLLTLFVSAETLDPGAGNVLFNFHDQGRWKRMTIYSRLYPQADTTREFFGVEITLPPGTDPDPETAFAELKTHLSGLGLASDLSLEGHTVVKCAYPLYRPGEWPKVAELIAEIRAAGVISVGRQGRFEYLPTSTGVIKRVAEELEADALPAPLRADSLPLYKAV